MNKNIKLFILVIIILVLAKGLVFAIIVPKWEVPDEQHYFRNIEILSKGQIPYFEVTSQTGHPALYEGLMLPFYLLTKPMGTNVMIFVLRLIGVILFATTVYLSFLVAKELFENNTIIQILVPINVALNPQAGFMTASVNSESLVNALFSLFILIIVKASKAKMSTGKAIWLVVIVGGGLLLKERFLVAAVLLIVFAIYRGLLYLRHNLKRIRNFIENQFTTSFDYFVKLPLVIFSFVTLSLVSKILITIPINYFNHAFIWTPHAPTNIYGFFLRSFKQFWASFGWLQIFLPRNLYIILGFFTLISAFGLTIHIVKLIKENNYSEYRRTSLALLALAVITVFTVVFVYEWRTGASQGRYYFIALLPIAVFFSLGLNQFIEINSKKLSLCLPIIFLGLVGLNIYSLLWQIYPFYH